MPHNPPAKTKRAEDTAEQLYLNCECGNHGMVHLKHWQKMHCVCGLGWWALRPKKNGPLVLFVWPGKRYLPTFRVTENDSRPIAEARQRIHHRNTTERFYVDESLENNIGVKAEIAFSRWSGLPIDMNLYEFGDGHIDFKFSHLGRQYSVDVKGAQNAPFLIVRTGDIQYCADFIVLCEVTGEIVKVLGYTTKDVIRQRPVKDFGKGILNHWLPMNELTPMELLEPMISK